MTKRGKSVRMDFRLLQADPPWRLLWQQELAGTPFAHVLEESLTEVVLEPDGDATVVTIAQRQKLKGYSRTGGLLMRRGGGSRLDGALKGLAELLSDQGAGQPRSDRSPCSTINPGSFGLFCVSSVSSTLE